MSKQWYFEDFHPGQEIALGERLVTEQEILAFAREFDPQPFHVDREAAGASIYGGVIASGWHTCSMMMRMVVDGLMCSASGMGSPGLDGVRWLRPVRAGDTLKVRYLTTRVKASSSKPDRGVVWSKWIATNQYGEEVCTIEGMGMFGRRPAGGGARTRPVPFAELPQLVGTEVALSAWFAVGQDRIAAFAEATEDRQWIHVDPERCVHESPFGAPVAHGFLTLSLLPAMLESALHITGVRMALNYGLNRVRFPAPLPAGSRVRGRWTLAALEPVEGGVQLTWAVTVEAQDGAKPVCAAEFLVRAFP